MDINVSISAALNDSTKQFVVAIYAVSAPTVLVQKIVPVKNATAPYYANPFQVVFTGLTQQFYNLQLWESADTTPTGTLRNSSNFQPSSIAISIRADLYLTADVTPGFTSGGNTYSDASLVGWTWNLEQLGYGTLEPGTGKDYTQNSGGGWTLLNSIIANQQKFCIHFQPMVAAATPAPPSLISSAVILTNTTTLDSTYANKAILLQGVTPQITINLMPLSAITDFQVIYIFSAGGSHINASIRCQGLDKIQRNTQVTKVVLGQNEALKLFKYNGVFQVEYCSLGVDSVGQLVETYYGAEVNTIRFNGTLISRTTYERLWDRVNQMPAGVLVSETSKSNTDSFGNLINAGFFGTGDGSTTFSLPLLTYAGFRRAVDGSSRVPGSFQDLMLLTHQHEGTIGNLPTSLFGNGPSRLKGIYNGQGTGVTDLVSFPTDSTGNALTRTGSENRPANTGIFVGCRI